MNRAQFFRGMLGLVGLGQKANSSSNTKWIQDAPLKPGEERCPLGHVQRPKLILEADPADREEYRRSLTMLMEYRGAWIIPRVCAVCGIVYVEQEKA